MRCLQERVARTILDGTVDNTNTHTHTYTHARARSQGNYKPPHF
jgi:hypothetical protein